MGAATLTAGHPDAARWRPLLGAMSKTGGAALVSGLLGALAVKTIAVVAGPAHVALFATLQQIRQAGLAAATGNGLTAVVRGTSALDGVARREYLRTSSWIFAGATALVALILILAPQWVARLAGLPPPASRALPWLTVAVIGSSSFVFASALLNGLGRIGTLANLQVWAAVAMAAGACYLSRSLYVNSPEALSWLLGFSAAMSALAAVGALSGCRGEWRTYFCGPGRMWSASAARGFLTMSAGMLVSGLLASCVLLLVRARITSTQGVEVTGHFDAAWGISMNHAALVLSSLQAYYLPALARAREPVARSHHISNVLAVTAGAAAILITGIAYLKPQLIFWFYAQSFRPGALYLRWTLIGDYLKVTSWVLSIPLLAAANMRVFVAADVAAYGTFWVAAMVLAHWFTAAASAAMAFVLMYLTHLLICGIYLFGYQHVRITRAACAAWLAGLALVASASALFWSRV